MGPKLSERGSNSAAGIVPITGSSLGSNERDHRKAPAVIGDGMDAERVLSQLTFGQLWKRTVPESRHDEVSHGPEVSIVVLRTHSAV